MAKLLLYPQEIPRRGIVKKIDYRKELKRLCKPSSKSIGIVDITEMNCLMSDGQEAPNTSQEYSDTIEAFYAISHALKS